MSEKVGGRGFNVYSVADFQNCMDICNMLDLGFLDSKLTSVNERLD